MTKNSERLKAYKSRLRGAGFKRLNVWVCGDLVTLLANERLPKECGGRTIERLLLGKSKRRPPF